MQTIKKKNILTLKLQKIRDSSVLLLDGQLDVPVVSMLEQKFEKSRFMRVDSDIIDRLIVKDDVKKTELDSDQADNLSAAFRSQMPKINKVEFNIEVQALGENGML